MMPLVRQLFVSPSCRNSNPMSVCFRSVLRLWVFSFPSFLLHPRNLVVDRMWLLPDRLCCICSEECIFQEKEKMVTNAVLSLIVQGPSSDTAEASIKLNQLDLKLSPRRFVSFIAGCSVNKREQPNGLLLLISKRPLSFSLGRSSYPVRPLALGQLRGEPGQIESLRWRSSARAPQQPLLVLEVLFSHFHFTHPVNCICVEIHWPLKAELNQGRDRQTSPILTKLHTFKTLPCLNSLWKREFSAWT